MLLGVGRLLGVRLESWKAELSVRGLCCMMEGYKENGNETFANLQLLKSFTGWVCFKWYDGGRTRGRTGELDGDGIGPCRRLHQQGHGSAPAGAWQCNAGISSRTAFFALLRGEVWLQRRDGAVGGEYIGVGGEYIGGRGGCVERWPCRGE
jgi:hypothetical protein